MAKIAKRTDDSKEEHRLQADFASAAYDTLVADNFVYISLPITSGPKLLEYMEERGFKTLAEAAADKEAFFKSVVAPNLQNGLKVSGEWSAKIDGVVIAPTEFEKRLRGNENIGWGQDDYMGMWLPLIDKKVTHIVMLDGWQYSNGAGEEYLQAVLMQMGRRPRSNIDITDAQGTPLPLDKGIRMVAEAYKDMHSRGLKSRNIAETLFLLLESEERFSHQKTQGTLLPVDKRSSPSDIPPSTVSPYDSKAVQAIRQEMLPMLVADCPDIPGVLKTTSSFDYSPVNNLFQDEQERKAAAKKLKNNAL